MAIDIFSLWHASLRHPAGNTPLLEGEPCVPYVFMNFSSVLDQISSYEHF